MPVNFTENVVGPLKAFGYTKDDRAVQILYDIACFVVKNGLLYAMATGFISSVLNIYIAIKIASVQVYSTNFRLVTVLINCVTTTITIGRCIYALTPPSFYSVETYNYLGATLIYFVSYFTNICSYTFNAKFLIVATERRVAFNKRATYENEKSKTRSLISVYLIISGMVFITTVKTGIVLFLCGEMSDYCLKQAFIVDFCFPALTMSHLIAGFSLIYGIWTFYNLNQKSRRIRRNCTTLTEAFIVKEIINVIKIDYVLVDTYNIYSTCSMVWHFKQLRRIFFKDITSIVPTSRVYSTGQEDTHLDDLSATDRANMHFGHLKQSWHTETLRKTIVT
ncbi:unnamed protein product [Bursaphelenchus okinawaensis]|uniref:G_PROTEIN_RECEP_F1_2 domain-containing protein n=1 Tax=Bursaphelenchus okinawaensis TaxID=465554 RepID=A0A811KYW4_9BILA|nr:unnamed protein product [Bursaphelenchus okinawaensis]CAG9113982.1 unnamed protein product [Bursaphelenchus okinawaensis]